MHNVLYALVVSEPLLDCFRGPNPEANVGHISYGDVVSFVPSINRIRELKKIIELHTFFLLSS